MWAWLSFLWIQVTLLRHTHWGQRHDAINTVLASLQQETWLWIPSTHANNLGWQYMSAVPEPWRQRPEHPWNRSHTSAYKLQVQRETLSQRLCETIEEDTWNQALGSTHTHTETCTAHTQTHTQKHTHTVYVHENHDKFYSTDLSIHSPISPEQVDISNAEMELDLSQLQKPKGKGRCYPCTWPPHYWQNY